MAVGAFDFSRHHLLLGHAAAQADDEVRVFLPGVDQLAHCAEDLFFRVLPDSAGVDDDDPGRKGVPGEAAAHIPKHPHDALAVVNVLLAAVGIHHGQQLPVRAAEKGGQPPGKFLLPPDLSGGEDHLCSVQKQFPRRLVE